MRRVQLRRDTWQHPDHGELEAIWDVTEPGHPHLIAIQPSLWCPAAEVEELVRLARAELEARTRRS